MDRKELREALINGRLYDYVAEHYYEMSKDDLKELILNLDWVATTGRYYNQELDYYRELDEQLNNRDFWDD